MLDFAPNNTWRYRVQYHSNGLTHRVLFRTGEDSPATTGADLLLNALLPEIASFLPTDFALLSSEQSEPGSDIFVPADIEATMADVTPTATPDKAHGPNYLTFSGKDRLGALYDFQIFGIAIAPSTVDGKNFRFEQGDNANIDSAIAVIKNDVSWQFTTTISANPVKYRNYANYGVSAYWQRQLR